MNKPWLLSILGLSLILLTIQKIHEIRSLAPYYKGERTVRLEAFQEARSKVKKDDLELLKLWESILTGRSAPLSRIIKERYQVLGLNHIFTPSGFHLSAVLFPFMKFLKKAKYQFFFLLVVGAGLFFLPGLGALKRMVLIKSHQKLLGLHVGFCIALLMDVFFGSFQTSALSFTYSFLFLGIIYSGLEGLLLIFWFFVGQVILAYFQGADISLMLLLFSPVLNLGFTFLMPVLFLLSFPLWGWQLGLGLFLLKSIQHLVNVFAFLSFKLPTLEIHMITLLLLSLVLARKWKWVPIVVLLMSNSLNLDLARTGSMPRNEFVPRGEMLKTIYAEKYVRVVFSDGSCRLKLVRGFWWENCSPRRKSSRRKKV